MRIDTLKENGARKVVADKEDDLKSYENNKL